MIPRRQLPVASPIDPARLVGASVGAAFGNRDALESATRFLRERLGARSVRLTDSGTSALVLALRLAMPNGGTVAFPGYACVDLAAAARYAGVRVRLYDIDPHTLSPDLDSVHAVIERGVDAIVVAHLFGYPADVPAVRELARSAGVVVIEDAAQGAGGEIGAARVGAFGDLAVLSFGRGKGLCAGGGGALLAHDERLSNAVAALTLPESGRGLGSLVATAAQWMLGRPALYALPSMLPWLRLGEMVYHPATEPMGPTRVTTSLLATAFALEAGEVALRRAHAQTLGAIGARDVVAIRAIDGARSGYLRYAVLDRSRKRLADASLGIVQPYPRTLAEQDELRPALVTGEPATHGASELRAALFALPTHHFVGDDDIARLARWLRAE